MIEPAQDVGLVLRFVLAAVFGAVIGLEREVHGHPAGMRTHLLVALGAAIFTVMSIHGFGQGSPAMPVDPSRVAAQIVTGIGFLGAGAILKEGVNIRGLTTAASLWASAAVGLAAGTGSLILASAGTLIVLFSLWPLNRVAERIHGLEKRRARLLLVSDRLDTLVDVFRVLVDHGLEIVGLRTQALDADRYEVAIDLRVRATSDIGGALATIGRLESVQIIESGLRT